MSKPLVTRVGDRIVRIRFKIKDSSAILQHASIVDQLPRDKTRSEWIVTEKKFDVIDGWAEVTPR
jgi:hypothetical protein